MDISQVTQELTKQLKNQPFEKEEVEEIIFLLENDVSLYHLAKTHLTEAIQEALLYHTPDF